MKSRFLLFLISFVICCPFSGCEKDRKNDDGGDGALITHIIMPSASEIFSSGSRVTVSGKGFAQGDRIFLLKNVRSNNAETEVIVVTVSNVQIIFSIPDNMENGYYMVVLKRENAEVSLGTITISTPTVDPPIADITDVLYLDGVSVGTSVTVTFTDNSDRTAPYEQSGIKFTESESNKTVKRIQATGLNNGSSELFIDRTVIFIGRKASEVIRLSFDNSGSLQLRTVEENGYRPIGSYAEFQLISNDAISCNGKYRQEANLDLMNEEWRAVQYYVNANSTEPFTGEYDGAGYSLANLKIDKVEADYQGVFGSISGGMISNLHIISGSVKGNDYVGGVCGKFVSASSIAGCSNSAKMSGRNYVGGIAGSNSGKLDDCHNKGAVSGSGSVGGISGSSNGDVADCYNTGVISGTSASFTSAGGVVGNNVGNLSDCHNTGRVSGRNDTGGVAGNNSGSISDCYNTGVVSGTDNYTYSGGIAGKNSGILTNCTNKGTVSGSFFVGGIAGRNTKNIMACSNNGNVSGGSYVSGVAGENSGEGNITASKNAGTINGTGSCVGGIAGRNYLIGTVKSCYNTNNVYGDRFVGGIVGENSGSTNYVIACYNIGKVTAGTGNYGGIVGYNNSSGVITTCYWRYISGGANYGIGTPQSDGNATRFSGTNWPLSSVSGWGLGNPTDQGAGYYWKIIGSWNNGAPVFPELWWE